MDMRTAEQPASRFPGRPLRVLVEDPALTSKDVASPSTAVEVTLCSGPGDGETCPLVMEGTCPLGEFDVVVSALDGPWAPSIRAAWAEHGTPHTVGAADVPPLDPLAHRVAEGMYRLWEPYREIT